MAGGHSRGATVEGRRQGPWAMRKPWGRKNAGQGPRVPGSLTRHEEALVPGLPPPGSHGPRATHAGPPWGWKPSRGRAPWAATEAPTPGARVREARGEHGSCRESLGVPATTAPPTTQPSPPPEHPQTPPLSTQAPACRASEARVEPPVSAFAFRGRLEFELESKVDHFWPFFRRPCFGGFLSLMRL